MGHLSSQKFAALVFCVFALSVTAFLLPAAAFGNLALAVTGLYTAFVGGRAWSDGQSLKYGGTVNTVDVSVNSGMRRLPRREDDEQQEEKEVD